MLTRLKNIISPEWITRLFMVFILLQPVIDLITSISLTVFKIEFTAGVLIRFFMMVVGCAFVLFYSDDKNRRRGITYLFILGGFFLVHFVINILFKSPIYLGEEIKYILKTVYFVIILVSYYYVLSPIFKQNPEGSRVERYIVLAMLFIGVTMLIAGLSNTAFNSYEYEKVGHKGWFFAGNEIGAIMAICFPITVLFAIKKTISLKSIYYWIPVVILIYSLSAVGTKVGFGAIILTIVISLFMLVYEHFRQKKIGSKKIATKINLITNTIVIMAFGLYIPFSPIAENTLIHLSIIDSKKETQVVPPEGVNTEITPDPNLNSSDVENLILSGRETFLETQKTYFTEAPLSQKLFGMGYGGNFEKEAKLVEMDFHDIFFSFGIIGFVIYMTPVIFMGILIISKILLNVKEKFNIETVLISSGIVLGLGIAYTAGHVFLAPAVSIYLALLAVLLYLKVVN